MDKPTARAHPLMIVGSYAAATEPGIHLFRLDHPTGALTPSGTVTGITNPSFLAVHPREPWLYAVSETSTADDGIAGSVWALRFDRDSQLLTPINRQPSGGDAPCHIAIHQSGRWLLVANYGSGAIGVLPILPDGAVGEMTDLVQHYGSGPDPDRQEGPHAHSSIFTPDNRFAIVADLGLDRLVVYAFDSAAGKLNAHTDTQTRPAAGPRHMAFHRSGQLLYVANELDSTVTVYDYDAGRGALRERQTIETLPGEQSDNLAAHIQLAPSAKWLYVSNRGHNSITVFDVEADGRLTRAAVAGCGGDWPRHFALAPGGERMLVANQRSDEITVLPISGGPETIGAAMGRATVARATCVLFGENL
jgi:6-phosphogluconolactonase